MLFHPKWNLEDIKWMYNEYNILMAIILYVQIEVDLKILRTTSMLLYANALKNKIACPYLWRQLLKMEVEKSKMDWSCNSFLVLLEFCISLSDYSHWIRKEQPNYLARRRKQHEIFFKQMLYNRSLLLKVRSESGSKRRDVFNILYL